MIRHFVALFCAIGLAFSPLAAAPASATQMADCAMGGDMPDLPADHSKMDCCTPACHAPSANASLPRSDVALPQRLGPSQQFRTALFQQLESVLASGLDPPPRS